MGASLRDACVLSADVSGGARLRQRLDATEALHALERCVRRMERAVAAQGGRVFKTSGEELAAVFPNAEHAVLAAYEMQRRVSDLPPVSGVELGLRVGVQLGQILEDGGEVLGEPCTVAARLAGAASSGQILTTAHTMTVLSPKLRENANALASAGDGDEGVFELAWRPARKSTERAAQRRDAAPWLVVHYGTREAVLDDACTEIRMGRDPASGIVIADKRASRNHARIERRPTGFYLVDESSNGTFVTFSGEPEFMLSHQDVVLRGTGWICFGHSAQDAGERAEFELRA
ncbi:MAG: hypothetical protein AUK49_03570 [Betaproteobacteria bacterium CG2_30_68_42]|nr:MAG: hypothetical protein AUK49_03570 [Betaproteobacteria bacterium CG2_30_68_42]